jgi:oxygen-independent coproporphyrinogen III oxidase
MVAWEGLKFNHKNWCLMPGIYIHIPFCRQACHYCNFHFSVSTKYRNAFVKALGSEIELQRHFFDDLLQKKSEIETFYLGGGTPSLLSNEQLKSIFEAIYLHFKMKGDAEVTLEANPDDLNPEMLRLLHDLPVNRLSIGIQSFQENDLRYMNRSHSAVQALKVLNDALEAGFDNISADLIYGTPGLDDQHWEENIMQLISMGIPHISAYSLTVESKTALDLFIRQGKAAPVLEEQAARQFEILCNVASRFGYDHYEISNFGKPGFYSKHNMSYWSGEPYLGLGPSAHSYLPGTRQWNKANTQYYIDALGRGEIPCEKEHLTEDQQYNEYIMTSIRTMWGIEKDLVKKRFGSVFFDEMLQHAKRYKESGVLIESATHLYLHQSGKFLADGIAADLFRS